MTRFLLYCFAGAISVLAFAPFHLWWMGIVSLSLLLLLLHANNETRTFWAGYSFGLGMFGLGTSWIFHSLHDYGNAPWLVAFALTCVATLVLSVFPAAVTRLYQQSVQHTRNRLHQVVLFACLWVLLEWLRSWVLTGFPWLLMGHALVDSPFAGILPIGGTFAGSAVCALFAAAIYQGLMAQGKANRKWLLWMAVSAALLLSFNLLHWTEPASQQATRVAALQANIPFEMKWDKSRRQEIYKAYLDLSNEYWQQSAGHDQANDRHLIVWPETSIPTFYRVANKDFIPLLDQRLRQHQSELISGVFTYEPGSERIFNSLVTLGGNEVQIYNKQHLVPFGEYLPLRGVFEFFRNLVTIPMADLSAGNGVPVVTMQSIPIGVSICYEAAYGNEINQALPTAQLLINVTNDAWFGDSLAPHQHLQIARVRALETGRYMVRAANTGISAIIDPKGQVTARSGQFVSAIVADEIWPMQGSTPFVRVGNWAIISSLSIVLLLILVSRRKSRD